MGIGNAVSLPPTSRVSALRHRFGRLSSLNLGIQFFTQNYSSRSPARTSWCCISEQSSASRHNARVLETHVSTTCRLHAVAPLCNSSPTIWVRITAPLAQRYSDRNERCSFHRLPRSLPSAFPSNAVRFYPDPFPPSNAKCSLPPCIITNLTFPSCFHSVGIVSHASFEMGYKAAERAYRLLSSVPVVLRSNPPHNQPTCSRLIGE